LRFGKRVDGAKAPLRHEALRAHGIQRRAAGPLQQGKRDRGAAVDEFGTELDGRAQTREVARPAAAADAAAGFENEDRTAGPRQLVGRGKPRSAGSYDDDVEDLRRKPIRGSCGRSEGTIILTGLVGYCRAMGASEARTNFMPLLSKTPNVLRF